MECNALTCTSKSLDEKLAISWDIINNINLWFIWKAQCKNVFEGSLEPPTETCKKFWAEIIHKVRGQFEAIQGDSGKSGLKFYSIHNSRLQWHYSPPRWLFTPSFRGL